MSSTSTSTSCSCLQICGTTVCQIYTSSDASTSCYSCYINGQQHSTTCLIDSTDNSIECGKNQIYASECASGCAPSEFTIVILNLTLSGIRSTDYTPEYYFLSSSCLQGGEAISYQGNDPIYCSENEVLSYSSSPISGNIICNGQSVITYTYQLYEPFTESNYCTCYNSSAGLYETSVCSNNSSLSNVYITSPASVGTFLLALNIQQNNSFPGIILTEVNISFVTGPCPEGTDTYCMTSDFSMSLSSTENNCVAQAQPLIYATDSYISVGLFSSPNGYYKVIYNGDIVLGEQYNIAYPRDSSYLLYAYSNNNDGEFILNDNNNLRSSLGYNIELSSNNNNFPLEQYLLINLGTIAPQGGNVDILGEGGTIVFNAQNQNPAYMQICSLNANANVYTSANFDILTPNCMQTTSSSSYSYYVCGNITESCGNSCPRSSFGMGVGCTFLYWLYNYFLCFMPLAGQNLPEIVEYKIYCQENKCDQSYDWVVYRQASQGISDTFRIKIFFCSFLFLYVVYCIDDSQGLCNFVNGQGRQGSVLPNIQFSGKYSSKASSISSNFGYGIVNKTCSKLAKKNYSPSSVLALAITVNIIGLLVGLIIVIIMIRAGGTFTSGAKGIGSNIFVKFLSKLASSAWFFYTSPLYWGLILTITSLIVLIIVSVALSLNKKASRKSKGR